MKHARESYNRIQDPEKKIGEDEPVFLLRAKDALAPDTVEHWALLLYRRGGDRDLARKAMDQATAMREYQKQHGAKLPDGD